MRRSLFTLSLLLASCHKAWCRGHDDRCSVAAFDGFLKSVPAASVNYVRQVPANGTFGGAPTNIPFPVNATALPELCAASINVQTPGGTSYNFGLFLPRDWNDRFLTTGNGGYGGGINWPDMGKFSHYGFATMSTDTGHSSGPGDGKWGLNQPEKLINWGHRAMHGSVVASKTVIAAYYASDIRFSYYASCSTGGRQGLKEIQLHPDSFDGVVVGAPAWWSPHLAAWTLKQGLLNLPETSPGHVPPSLFPSVADEMVRQCDPQDGLRDGIISDPFGCDFDFNQLLCRPGVQAASCLTPPQIETVYKTFSPFWDAGQTFIFPSVSLGTDVTPLSSAPSTLGIDFFRYWVFNDTNWDYTKFKYDDIVAADRVNPGQATADDFDLSPFKKRGGKLIHYHGLADDLIPAGSSLHFYNQVYRTLAPTGVDVDDFYRFFLVPGMSHCGGSARAPWYIGGGSSGVAGATHSVPGFEDSRHDVILAVMSWVEEGKAPEEIVATKYRNDKVADGVQSQRPLCVYPRQARYVHRGDPNVPSSWRCL